MNENQSLWAYILNDKNYLAWISVTGIIYNVGLTAGPYMEGQLAQCLFDVYNGAACAEKMLYLALIYVALISFVQAARYLKRLYVRKFGNAINRNIKTDVYRHFLISDNETEEGSILTKALSDVDACSEGIRKFTTEIFDTGIALVAYIAMLAWYDWKLTLVCGVFQLIAYAIAGKLGKVVAKNANQAKQSAEALNEATLDRIHLAITYRIFGQEENIRNAYERRLDDYEKKTVQSNVFESVPRPLYQIISMMGVIFIFTAGSRKVLSDVWNVAAFTAYLSCFTKMAVKASKAAKLFNAVQKAKVSWGRISPLLKKEDSLPERPVLKADWLEVNHLSFAYENHMVLKDISFHARPGEILGVTGEIACGKSTLGKMFLENSGYQGSILVNGRELFDLEKEYALVSYMGHAYELYDDTIENNIQLGKQGDISMVLKDACLKEEVNALPEGIRTVIGENGTKLSGGQQARIALARTLYHKRGILVLDDPFSACDQRTEAAIFEHLRNGYHDCIILILSHRLSIFNQMDRVLFMEEGRAEEGTHAQLMQNNATYRKLYEMQGGEEHA